MHIWGDEWFTKYGDELYTAINEIETRLRRHRIGVYGKEKYGTYRNEYLHFWDGSLCDIFYGYRLWHGRSWIERLLYRIDHGLVRTKKTRFGYLLAGVADLNRKIGLVRIVQRHQMKMFNKVFQRVVAKHPDIAYELVVMIDGRELIKPCKYGDFDADDYVRRLSNEQPAYRTD